MWKGVTHDSAQRQWHVDDEADKGGIPPDCCGRPCLQQCVGQLQRGCTNEAM